MNNEPEPKRDTSIPKIDLTTTLLFAFIVAVPWLYEGTTDQHRAKVILAGIPFLLLSFFEMRRARALTVFDVLSKWGLVAVAIGLVFGVSFAERSTTAWLRVLELAWAGSLVFCVACKIVKRPGTLFYIVAAIACAYCISNVRLYAEWMQTPGDPRSKDWAFAIPGYFHFRNLGFAATPALVALAWLPFSSQVQGLSSGRKLIAIVLLWLAATVGWGVLGWSGSRAGVLSALVGIGALAFFSQQRRTGWKLSLFSVSACFVGSVVSIPFTPFQDSYWGVLRIIGGISSVGPADEYSSGRITIWLDGLHRWADSWLAGIGPGQYISQPRLPSQIFEPHNVFIDVVLESGLFGLIGLVLVMVSVFKILYRSGRGGINAVVASLILSYGVFSMVDGTLVWTLPLTYISVLLGALLGLGAKKEAVPSSRFSFEAWGRAILPPVSLLCVVIFGFVQLQSIWLKQSVPEPSSFAARSLFHFPVTTWGVNTWLSEWEDEGEADLDAWYELLVEESFAPYYFRIEYSYFLLRKNRLLEARVQLIRALEIAPISVIPRLKERNEPVLKKLDELLQESA